MEAKNVDSSFEVVHMMSRRLASVDKYYLISVSSKPFNEYFGEISYGNILEAAYEEDKERLSEFIDSYDGRAKSEIFRFYNAKKEVRYNHLFLFENKGMNNNHIIDIEMVDIESIEATNKSLRDDVSKHKLLLGLAREYTFTYNRDNNIFSMYRYDVESREIIYKMDLDDWKRKMLSEGYIAESDRDMFSTLITEIRTYTQTFSVKVNTSMRTYNKVMETLRFVGTVLHKASGNKIVVGRVIPEENMHNYSQVADMIEELQYDSLTKVYNKKTITEYAIKLLKEEKNNRVTIAVLDVDHFKKVNDIYGHMYGDKVLARVGRKLKEVVGDDGVVGRIGGDEFIIVLNAINDEHTLRGILRAIRTQIKWEFNGDFEDITISCSIGAAFSPNNGTEYEELFRKADYCLYVAKEKGRDRYVFFRDDLHAESYMASQGAKDKNMNDGREMKELVFISGIMEKFSLDRQAAIKEIFEHMIEAFKVDSINVYWGPNLKKAYYMGKELNNSMDIPYINTEGFTKMLEDRNHIAIGFVGRQTDSAPEFGEAMRARDVVATIQCIIGSRHNIKGLLTLDKCKESSQWARYEEEIAVITAGLLEIMAELGE